MKMMLKCALNVERLCKYLALREDTVQTTNASDCAKETGKTNVLDFVKETGKTSVLDYLMQALY